MLKKSFKVFVSLVLFVCVTVLSACSGEQSEESEDLKFETVSEVLTALDTEVRVFLNGLDYKYKSTQEYESFELCSDFIKSTNTTLSQTIKEYQQVLDGFNGLQDTEDTEITKTAESITIKTSRQSYEAKLDEEHNNLSINFVDSKNEYLYEFIRYSETQYLCQIVMLNDGSDDYSIYQIYFKGNKGTIAIEHHATKFVPIYKTEITSEVFPNVDDEIYSNL